MSSKQSALQKLSLVVYVVMWSLFIIGGTTWLMMYLVGTLSDSTGKNELSVSDTSAFDAVVELTEKKVARYLGEWEFSEPKIPGHFHHIGRWYRSDKWDFCIDCHGPTPHARTPRERAFLNMHSLFIACNTCHVREQMDQPPTRFGWISLDNGRLCPNPKMAEGVWGEYGAKIVPLSTADNTRPVVLQQARDFAEKFRWNRNDLSDRQKVVANKFVHKNCVETPVNCTDCHKTDNAFIDFAALGYSPERTAFVKSAEVVDLASRYETFYLPNLLDAKDHGTAKPGDEPE